MFCYGLGNFYSKRKDYLHSIEYYDQSIKIDSNFSSAWNNKGLSLANLGRYEEAITSYDKVIEINPNNANAWYNRGTALDNLGRYEEAQNCFEKAKQLELNM